MTNIEFPFSGRSLKIALCETWDVHVCAPASLPALSEEEMRHCFEDPIGTPPLREVAKGKRSAAIVVEDVSRPMRVDRLMPVVIDELKAAGLSPESIVIVSAVGCHRPQTEKDFRQKLGDKIVDHYRTVNPYLYKDLVFMGRTDRGTPIYVNRRVVEAEIKIGVGGILPHAAAGFGGGGKTVMPGICGFETIAHHHLREFSPGDDPGQVEGNTFREDLEDAARLIHLDFSVNAVMGTSRETVGLFVGDMMKAHRQGVAFARKAYQVDARENADLAVINAFPEDYDFLQSLKALSRGMGIESVRPGGKILLTSACPDGFGSHVLYGPGGKGYEIFRRRKAMVLQDKELIISSPTLDPIETRDFFAPYFDVQVFQEVEEALQFLGRDGRIGRVNVFPFGGISLRMGGALQ